MTLNLFALGYAIVYLGIIIYSMFVWHGKDNNRE
jgi:hypothetical protein